MKTKEEILEHLKVTHYDCTNKINGWLVGKGLKESEEVILYAYSTNGGATYTFANFIAWVNQEEKKEDNFSKFGNDMDGMHATATLNMDCPAFHKRITPMELYETLNRILPEEDEPAYKADYLVFYNNTEYEIDADKIKEFADALCFFEGENKVASFPPKTPWIKI